MRRTVHSSELAHFDYKLSGNRKRGIHTHSVCNDFIKPRIYYKHLKWRLKSKETERVYYTNKKAKNKWVQKKSTGSLHRLGKVLDDEK